MSIAHVYQIISYTFYSISINKNNTYMVSERLSNSSIDLFKLNSGVIPLIVINLSILLFVPSTEPFDKMNTRSNIFLPEKTIKYTKRRRN